MIAGIDTLEIGYCIQEYKLSQDEWDTLEHAKEAAQATQFDKGTGIKFRGLLVMVMRTGSSRYKYILTNDDFDIRIFSEARSGSNFPELKVRFKSMFLWREGWAASVQKMDEWLRTWVEVSEVKVSRVDLTVDFLGPLPDLSPALKEVITRAKSKREFGNYERYAQGKQQNGYRFGTG